MEVTVVGSDVAVWTEVPIPAQTLTTGVCPALEDYVLCGTGGVGVRASKTQPAGSNLYILWRIHEESPKSLELIEFSCDKPVHNSGLRLIFESPLCPFASVVLVQEQSNQLLYNVTVLTVTGVLYSITVKAARYSKSRFSMQHQSTAESNIGAELTGLGRVTALIATPELLIAGGQSGSIFCFPVGGNSDQPFELRDGDSGLSRLWGFGFRGKSLSPVKCLTAQSLSDTSLLFAIHEDKTLKVWDLVHRNRQFSQSITPPLQLASSIPQSVWVEDVLPGHEEELQLALHYGGNPSPFETQRAAVVVCTVHATQSNGGIRVSHLTLQRTFSIGQGSVVSCKILADRVWVLLKEQGKLQCELFSATLEEDFTLQKCRLQELAVREQLFQGAGQSWDEFLFTLHHIGVDSSSLDDDLVSSVFLRRLLQPGLRQHAALKAVLQARGCYLSDFEIGSLTLDGLRKEIKASIRSEPGNSSGTLKEWISFCSNYEEAWTTNSIPYGLFTDLSSGAVGLIRKNSVSVIRTLTLFEKLVSKRASGNYNSGEAVSPPSDWDEGPGDAAVLGGLLTCLDTVTAHLGQMALGVFHEALLRPAKHSLDGLISSFLLILDVGYTPLDPAQVNVSFGVDEIRAKMQLHHQRQRKFALRISQSLRALREVAGSWDVALDVVAKYAQYLVFSTQSALPISSSAVVPLGSAPTKMLAQTACQIAWTHFEAARNLLLLLSYLVKAQGQVGLKPSEVTRIQLNLLPHVQEGLAINLLLHWLTVSFAEVPPSEDCSLQLSSLQIDGSRGEKVQPEMLGAGELALAEILAAAFLESTQVKEAISRDSLPDPDLLHNCAWRFVGWLLVGESANPAPVTFSGRAITLSSILLQHGQYGSLESFLNAVERFSPQQQLSDGIASTDGEWSARLHLLGICSLARAHSVLEHNRKEKHVGEAIQCFFRASSGVGETNKVLQTVFFVPQQHVQGRGATAAWRLQYFEWVMQLFDQYNLSEGACQFAHAALEQVDEAVGMSVIEDSENDTNATIKGRLWANVFKFSLDLELYGNAYCAVISNPDEESKDICLRRLIIVLCDHKGSLALCGNELPYGALLTRVEEELVTKAHNSDVSVKAGLFKLLYALHMHHHNVGRAAGYMYEYGMSLRDQGLSKSQPQALSLLKEQLDAFAAAINALQLVEAADEPMSTRIEWLSPVKRQRTSTDSLSNGKMIHTNKTKGISERRTIDVQLLVKEHALTLARLQLLTADAKTTSLSASVPPAEVVLSLLQHGLYEMAFSLVFLCWKDSSQKKELETAFEVMARKCCLLQLGMGSNSPQKMPEDLQALALVPVDSPSSEVGQWDALSTDIRTTHAKFQTGGSAAQSAWQSLKEYLEKYWKLHPNIRAVVADTILSVDRHMELPLWLINTFKGGKDARGMNSGGSWIADPAALLRIYLNHERYVEASYLLLEYLQAATRLRPGDIMKRKQAGGVWFPYTLVDRLLQRLSELHGSEERISQSKRLHASLHSAVLNHFDLIKKESDDVRVIAESADFNGPWKGFS